MNIVPAAVPTFYEVTFDLPGLFVAMSVYDITSSPTLVAGPSAMTNVVDNTYVKSFTAVANKSYLMLKGVYTDGTFTTLDTNYSQGSETIFAEVPGAGGGTVYVGMNTVLLTQDITNTVLIVKGC